MLEPGASDVVPRAPASRGRLSRRPRNRLDVAGREMQAGVFDTVLRAMHALKSPVRLVLVHALVQAGVRGATAAALRDELRLHSRALALHLRALRRGGLVTAADDRGVFIYRLDREAIEIVATALGAAAGHPDATGDIAEPAAVTDAETLGYAAAAFYALSRPNRLQLHLRLVNAGSAGLPLQMLQRHSGVAAGPAARALLALRYEGLIVQTLRGTGVRCAVDAAAVRWLFDVVVSSA